MALATLSAVTVLDVSAATADTATSVSPFAGSWFGTWSIAGTESGGTFDWTISDAGWISGTLTHTNDVAGGAMVGHVSAGGKLVFVGQVPSDDPAAGGNGYAYKGTAVIDGGKLVVSAKLVAPPFSDSLTAILVKN